MGREEQKDTGGWWAIRIRVHRGTLDMQKQRAQRERVQRRRVHTGRVRIEEMGKGEQWTKKCKAQTNSEYKGREQKV